MTETFQTEAAATFEKAIATLTDIYDRYADTVFGGESRLARVRAQRDGIAELWDRYGARLQSAGTLDDAVAVIGAIVYESEPEAHVEFTSMVTPSAAESEMSPEQKGRRDASQFAVAEIRRLAAQHLDQQ